jgi:hypothetical protein
MGPRTGNPPRVVDPVPKRFKVVRDLPIGRHPLLAAFPGLDRLPTARRLVKEEGRRAKLFDETCVEVVEDDIWMYIAPHDLLRPARRRWKPVLSRGSDCIVVGEKHLRESPELVLFLDIFHELCHLLQRQAGRNLWEPISYVRRSTEIEAYRFVVDEARQLGVRDPVLREYLIVEWIDESEYRELLDALGVPAA